LHHNRVIVARFIYSIPQIKMSSHIVLSILIKFDGVGIQ
jgi:hypothetical protein